MTLCIQRSPSRKRPYSDIGNQEMGSPHKRAKQRKCLAAIKSIKPAFNAHKLQIDQQHSIDAARDHLFIASASFKSKYIRWVLACKFIIASGLRFDSYDVWGMKRAKLPQNMSFYVDNQQNLCCLIHENDQSALSKQIIRQFCAFSLFFFLLHSVTYIQHHFHLSCNKIETSVIQTYSGCYEQQIEQILDKFPVKDQKEKENVCSKNEESSIHIVRIPMIYYKLNMNGSFYAFCCRFAHFYYSKQEFRWNPLINLIGKNVANFDCFQSSVPKIWSRQQSIYEMFTYFGLEEYMRTMVDEGTENAANLESEFGAFVAAYDCFTEIEYRKKCRKQIQKCWTEVAEEMSVMRMVIEYSDMTEMSDMQMFEYIDKFDQSTERFRECIFKLDEEAEVDVWRWTGLA